MSGRYPGFYRNDHSGILRFLLSVGYWAVILAIVAGFFVLESDVTAGAANAAGQIILVLLVLAEIGTIFLWSVIIG